MSEILSFPNMISSTPVYTSPLMDKVRESYNATGYRQKHPSVGKYTTFLRGSTATLLEPNGNPKLRSPLSDVDIVNIENGVAPHFYIRFVSIPGIPHPVEVDVLTLPTHFRETPRSMFFASRLLQTGWVLQNKDRYRELKIDTFGRSIERVTAHNQGYLNVTPSGIARLLLELNLAAEPWRIDSFRTAYVTSPYADRNKAQFIDYINRALQRMIGEGKAIELDRTDSNTNEPVYQLHSDVILPALNGKERMLTLLETAVTELTTGLTAARNTRKQHVYRMILKIGSILHMLSHPLDASQLFL